MDRPSLAGGSMSQTCFQDGDLDGECSNAPNSPDVTTLYSSAFKMKRAPAVTALFKLQTNPAAADEGGANGGGAAAAPLKLKPGSVVDVKAVRVDWPECTAIALTLEASTNNFGATACAEGRVCQWDQDGSWSTHRGTRQRTVH